MNDSTVCPDSRSTAAVPILMYHNIATVPKGITSHTSLYVAPASFARQLRLMRLLGYTGLSMSAAMPYLRGEKQGRVFVITLDDGYRDNLENALPILKKNGFTATCYVVSDSLSQYNVWDSEKLGIRKAMMSPEELRRWHDAGMEVGAHTRRHPHLTTCDDAQLHDELNGSKARLEDCLGSRVTQFCYPYGDVDARVAEATRAAGFEAATTTRRGRTRAGDDLYWLPRVPVARRHVLPSFVLRLLTNYEEGRT